MENKQRGSFMPSIRFKLLTKEIEMKGSESFIESNFNRVHALLGGSFGVKEKMVSRMTKTHQEPVPVSNEKTSQAFAEIEMHQLSETSRRLAATKSAIPEIPHGLSAKRPPLRKYIRKEGLPGHQRVVVEVVEQKPTEISIASLKEKFGLSESKIGGIIRDAEKLGKIRRVMGGSYSWT
jgi:hypothetical protein